MKYNDIIKILQDLEKKRGYTTRFRYCVRN